jgi:hypothetical protein
METNLTLEMILEQLEVSLIPWLIVTVLSLGLGYGLAALLRHWFLGRPRTSHWLELLPWRSVAIWIALIAVNTPITMIQFGLGSVTGGIVGVGVALGSFMIPWVTAEFLHAWFPLSTREKIFSVVRMAAILSMVFPVFLIFGMGFFIYVSNEDVGFPQKMILAYEVLGAMLLATEIVLGIVQFAISGRLIQRNPSGKASEGSLPFISVQ